MTLFCLFHLFQYPEGYLEAQAKKEAEKNDKKGKRKRKSEVEDENSSGKSVSLVACSADEIAIVLPEYSN